MSGNRSLWTPSQRIRSGRGSRTLLARGMTNKAIAAALGISPNTVKAQLHLLYARIGVANRTEAAAKMAQRAA